MYRSISVCCLGAALLLGACKSNTNKGEEGTPEVVAPLPAGALNFSGDTAYNYVKTQVAFGPRVPGTPAQKATAAWLEGKLKATCDTVYRQEVTVTGGDSITRLPCINLIGAINPAAKRRYLLLAHWDTRPWADAGTEDRDQPIDGADDGASGVAILLEIARQLKANPLPATLGVDILLVDVEDWGKNEWGEASYGLGTQYWARNMHLPSYRAEGGILLDMVGAKDARFPLEQSSTQYAGTLQQQVWQSAGEAGFSSYFPFESSPGGITDDHTFVNEITKIPTIDIIHLTRGTLSSFPAHWHTHNDNLSIISTATLEAVGKTVLQFLRRQGLQG